MIDQATMWIPKGSTEPVHDTRQVLDHFRAAWRARTHWIIAIERHNPLNPEPIRYGEILSAITIVATPILLAGHGDLGISPIGVRIDDTAIEAGLFALPKMRVPKKLIELIAEQKIAPDQDLIAMASYADLLTFVKAIGAVLNGQAFLEQDRYKYN